MQTMDKTMRIMTTAIVIEGVVIGLLILVIPVAFIILWRRSAARQKKEETSKLKTVKSETYQVASDTKLLLDFYGYWSEEYLGRAVYILSMVSISYSRKLELFAQFSANLSRVQRQWAASQDFLKKLGESRSKNDKPMSQDYDDIGRQALLYFSRCWRDFEFAVQSESSAQGYRLRTGQLNNLQSPAQTNQ